VHKAVPFGARVEGDEQRMTALQTVEGHAPLLLGLTRYQWLALVLCALTFLVEGFDMSAMSFAAPTVGKLWEVKATELSTAIVALNIGAVIGNGLLAPIGDRFSRKWVIVAGTLLLGAGVGLTATSMSITQLVTWRFLSGLAFGVAIANVVALIAEQFPRNRRALLVVVAATNLSVGSAICGFSAAHVTQSMGWQGLFVIGGIAGVLLASLIALIIRDHTLEDTAADGDPSHGLGAKVPILRLFEPRLFGITISLWLIGFCNAAILFVMLNWLPTMLTSIGWTLGEATRAPAFVSVAGTISGIALAVMVDTGHATRALRGAFVCLIVTMALFAFVPPDVMVWTGMLMLAGMLCSGVHYVERGLYATLYPTAVRATGVGWGNMMSRLGNIISTTTVAILIDLHLDVGKTLGLLAIPAILSLLCTIPLARAYRRRDAMQQAAAA
jgi:MFS transporter, AAHS family, 4-hydroxybenzoate transporter